MVVVHKECERMDLKKLAVDQITNLIERYKSSLGVESIHFYESIDGIVSYKDFIYLNHKQGGYTDKKGSWYFINGCTLLKVLNTLKDKNFYGLYKMSDNKFIRIKPKKYVINK